MIGGWFPGQLVDGGLRVGQGRLRAFDAHAACTAVHSCCEMIGYRMPRLSPVRPLATLTASTPPSARVPGSLLRLTASVSDVIQRRDGSQGVVGRSEARHQFLGDRVPGGVLLPGTLTNSPRWAPARCRRWPRVRG